MRTRKREKRQKNGKIWVKFEFFEHILKHAETCRGHAETCRGHAEDMQRHAETCREKCLFFLWF